jgi:dUTPase
LPRPKKTFLDNITKRFKKDIPINNTTNSEGIDLESDEDIIGTKINIKGKSVTLITSSKAYRLPMALSIFNVFGILEPYLVIPCGIPEVKNI